MRRAIELYKKYIQKPGKMAFCRAVDAAAHFFSGRCRAVGPSQPPSWKQKALDDFSAWLDDMPVDEPMADAGSQMDGCDLYSLLTEFVALRQEIKLQNREQNRAFRIQADIVDAYREGLELFKRRTADLIRWEENIRAAGENRAVLQFLDVRDALVRGLSHSRERANKGTFFRRSHRQISSIADGYEMALRRFDQALSRFGIVCVNTENASFDPKSMQAMDRRKVSGMPPGMVVEAYSGGFVREDKVLRTAKVVVSE